jgi:hypothetical protein
VQEDLLLIVALKRIELDLAVGMEQPKDTYRERVKEFYDLHKEEDAYERTATSLRHH